ncbi:MULTISPECIES: hypothetical protein [Burkholderia cepacia complex]|uniref:Uncharacterized protein n=1 Tax=Burkholderia semiarida TaxID=2843303 RepID=A0ABW7LEN7_9BURK|nr:hypothetical protein [Burkholderia anthina]
MDEPALSGVSVSLHAWMPGPHIDGRSNLMSARKPGLSMLLSSSYRSQFSLSWLNDDRRKGI